MKYPHILTFNQRVVGSKPAGLTNDFKYLLDFINGARWN